jgi:hypothetical protein
MYSRLTNE